MKRIRKIVSWLPTILLLILLWPVPLSVIVWLVAGEWFLDHNGFLLVGGVMATVAVVLA